MQNRTKDDEAALHRAVVNVFGGDAGMIAKPLSDVKAVPQ